MQTALWLGDHGMAATVAAATGMAAAQVADGAVAGTPTGRFTRPEEVGSIVAFLATGGATNITGADVRIDGWMLATV